jgi:hypothetical protein
MRMDIRPMPVRNVIGGRQPVATAADDDDIVSASRLACAPSRRPTLPAEIGSGELSPERIAWGPQRIYRERLTIAYIERTKRCWYCELNAVWWF